MEKKYITHALVCALLVNQVAVASSDSSASNDRQGFSVRRFFEDASAKVRNIDPVAATAGTAAMVLAARAGADSHLAIPVAFGALACAGNDMVDSWRPWPTEPTPYEEPTQTQSKKYDADRRDYWDKRAIKVIAHGVTTFGAWVACAGAADAASNNTILYKVIAPVAIAATFEDPKWKATSFLTTTAVLTTNLISDQTVKVFAIGAVTLAAGKYAYNKVHSLGQSTTLASKNN